MQGLTTERLPCRTNEENTLVGDFERVLLRYTTDFTLPTLSTIFSFTNYFTLPTIFRFTLPTSTFTGHFRNTSR
jgi:hypothetical protein